MINTIKIYLGNTGILCFHATIDFNDIKSLEIKEGQLFKGDTLYLELFNTIVNGKIKSKYVDKDRNEYHVEINEGSWESNIKKYIELQKEFFSSQIVFD